MAEASSLRPRPEAQRTDLGPITNYLATDLYERAGEAWRVPRDLIAQLPLKFQDLDIFAGSMTDEVVRLLHHGTDDVDWSEMEKLVTEKVSLPGDEYGVIPLTHYSERGKVMEEGIKTGVAIPLFAYRHMLAARSGRRESDLFGEEIDLEHMATTLRSKPFQAALLHFAYGPNGIYGENASKPGALQTKENPLTRLVTPAIEETDGRPVVGTLMKDFLQTRRDEHPESDGCVVRFSTYAEIGDSAVRFAHANDIDTETLIHQKASAIVVACEYVADCTDALASYGAELFRAEN